MYNKSSETEVVDNVRRNASYGASAVREINARQVEVIGMGFPTVSAAAVYVKPKALLSLKLKICHHKFQ
jgi:hypothetical protein